MADAVFEDPRLAHVYDALDPDRSDLDVYLAMVGELRARSVLDVGCGTGTLACMLATRAVAVVGVDPALASLDLARRKPGAEQVPWLHGDATTLPPLRVDAAVMTGNVAQVFTTDHAWLATLRSIHDALRPGGWLAFETRVPSQRAWERWRPELTRTTVDVDGAGIVESWHELIDVLGSVVTFRTMIRFDRDDLLIESRPRCGSAIEPNWKRPSPTPATRSSTCAMHQTGQGSSTSSSPTGGDWPQPPGGLGRASSTSSL